MSLSSKKSNSIKMQLLASSIVKAGRLEVEAWQWSSRCAKRTIMKRERSERVLKIEIFEVIIAALTSKPAVRVRYKHGGYRRNGVCLSRKQNPAWKQTNCCFNERMCLACHGRHLTGIIKSAALSRASNARCSWLSPETAYIISEKAHNLVINSKAVANLSYRVVRW